MEALEELEPSARQVFIKVFKALEKSLGEVVRREDFLELKAVVEGLARRLEELTDSVNHLTERITELAEAQRRTEQEISDLRGTVRELTEAQKHSEQRLTNLEQTMAELAEAQRKTEQRVNELAEAQRRTEEAVTRLARGLENTRSELGGLSRSVSYALENEAFRYLPRYLKTRYGIEVVDRIVRTYLKGREVNIFGRVRQDGREMYLVGEAVLRLEKATKFRQLKEMVSLVKEVYGGEVLPIVVTHFARPKVLERAEKEGILVVQSFEWI